MTGRVASGLALQAQPIVRIAILSAPLGQLARLLDRFALLCVQDRIEPHEPRRACLVEFGDAFS
jgi:hypothetical protein